MTPFPRLSITWNVRLLNGALSAVSLIALIVLAQVRIHSVLYGAVDRTLTTQAVDVTKRPHGGPRGQQGEFRGGPRGGGPRDGGGPRGPGGGRDGGPPPFPHQPWDGPGLNGPDGESGTGQRFPGPESRPGVPRREPEPVRYGAISLMPIRHLPLDGPGGPEPWSVAGRKAVESGKSGKPDVRTEIGGDGMRVRVVSLRSTDGPGPGEIVQTAALLEPTDATLREIDTALYMLLFPLAIVAAVLGAFLTEMALAPVRQLARIVGTIEPENLAARLPEPGGNDAFDRLALLMNALLVRLEGAFARQKRFTGSASHELRTPLAVIKSATSLLLENPESLTPLQHRVLDRADQSADRANRLVTDLLTLARTDSNTLPVRLSSVIVGEIVGEVVSEMTVITPESSVPVVCHIPEGMMLRTDPDHFRRLLQNLIGNALRHTLRGQVSVAANGFGGNFQLSIRDTGEGIAPDALARLGEPFYRPDASRAREHGGAGLGLSLCKGIVAALGGTIRFESIIGQGTTVSVTLPRVSDEIPGRER